MLKPTALRSILAFDSAHPLSVHGAWLKAFLNRIWRHSHNLRVFEDFKIVVLDRLCDAGVDHAVLEVLNSETAHTYPVSAYHNGPIASKLRTVRLVVPFHPMWEMAFSRTRVEISRHLAKLQMAGVSDIDRIGVAWSLKSAPLVNLVRKH